MILRPSRLATAITCALLSVPVLAEWTLDNEASRLSFVSIKNASVAELHHFKALSGTIGDDGAARIVIDLDSVETLIPIRNQRMRELLFETVRFPAATLSAQVPTDLGSLQAGESRATSLEVSIDLHGVTAPYAAKADVTRLADGSLQVVLSEPVLVKAADFGLDAGIEMLREVAGLGSISTAVPVDASLVFTPGE
jgi:polyisoprenoid-binding protein YceI